MKELKIDVFGRVQGVGFRQYVKKTADRLGVKGNVRNLTDGRVSIIAQGSRSVLSEFLAQVQQGPFLAKVNGVSYLWREGSHTYPDFVIVVDTPFIKDQQSSFTRLGKHLLNLQKTVPRHIAIIPDGNRRWAKERALSASEGHQTAASKDHMVALLKTFKELGVPYFSFWGFSTENWARSKGEIEHLFDLFRSVITRLKEDLVKEQIHFRHLGRKDRLPEDLVKGIDELERITQGFTQWHLQICLDYGGRDELARAVTKLLQSGTTEVTEEDISRYLDTYGVPDPDLIIRTSGEQRTSGFMPYQSSYAEWYFTEVKFPDFGPQQLREAVAEFERRKRNFGK